MIKASTNNPPILSAEELSDSEVWPLPHVEPKQAVDDGKTNALGQKNTWKYEPPEETEIAEPVPLTAEEIEEIQKAAFEEGFNQGKEEGFAKGFDEGKVSGHEEGLKTGHEEGLANGIAEGEQVINEQLEQLKALVGKLHKPLEKVEKNVEEQLLHLVVQLTEAITLEEAKTNPDIVLSAITNGIKALPCQEDSTQILLNPNDIRLVEEKLGGDYLQEQGWRLLPAPQLDQGSCQIENSISNIDLQVKSRIREVLDSFLQEALHQ
ncbi:flagellar assembly protein FliH [Thalassotalea sp. PLHSN55]|uniref:flagellar assembly protein FliH n=1 Tax=Thalassotalea sp. PLHSN55 TaxID=3435888 RepID=UPI003F855082